MINIGNRRELFIDDYLIERLDNARLSLHSPEPREVVITHDEPWEGNTSYYHTIMRDGNILRMYYRASHYDEDLRKNAHEHTCYAVSTDGIRWEKPELGIHGFHGSRKNNIVWTDPIGAHNFTPFRDWNPSCAPGMRYKAVGRKGKTGLYGLSSPDGVAWSLIREEPLIVEGAFDSQNLVFWDDLRGCYVDYHRGFRNGVREIMTSTSKDFYDWEKPQWLDYGADSQTHLYTNQIEQYPRAPHIYIGFPKRYIPDRNPTGHPAGGVSDIVFMTSRDGLRFHRWDEAVIRPGLLESRWVNRNNFVAWGVVQTAPLIGDAPEISIYSAEDYYRGRGTALRRYSYRLDGFASLSAPMSGGVCVTRPFIFEGSTLELNFSTSAAGSIEITPLEADETPIEAVRFEPIYGDGTAVTVRPAVGSMGMLSGKPVRLRIALRDADLFSFRFV